MGNALSPQIVDERQKRAKSRVRISNAKVV